MKRPTAVLLYVSASLLAAAPLAGCGDSDELPDDAVAQVGETVITKSEFERALKRTGGRADDPREGDGLRSRIMRSLIEDEWIRQEADERGIEVTDAEVQKALDRAQASGFLSDDTLRKADLTARQLLPSIRDSQLQKKVTAELTRGSTQVSPEDAADFYRENKAELIVPERRDLRIVITKSRDKAAAARTALAGGRSWHRVAKEYSQHDASRDNGGRITGLRRPSQPTGLAAAIFRAGKGELVGPVEGEGSWAVFVVERVKPSFQATLDQARDEIQDLLASRRRRRALAAFTTKYRDETTCAPGFKVPSCKNGPKPRQQ